MLWVRAEAMRISASLVAAEWFAHFIESFSARPTPLTLGRHCARPGSAPRIRRPASPDRRAWLRRPAATVALVQFRHTSGRGESLVSVVVAPDAACGPRRLAAGAAPGRPRVSPVPRAVCGIPSCTPTVAALSIAHMGSAAWPLPNVICRFRGPRRSGGRQVDRTARRDRPETVAGGRPVLIAHFQRFGARAPEQLYGLHGSSGSAARSPPHTGALGAPRGINPTAAPGRREHSPPGIVPPARSLPPSGVEHPTTKQPMVKPRPAGAERTPNRAASSSATRDVAVGQVAEFAASYCSMTAAETRPRSETSMPSLRAHSRMVTRSLRGPDPREFFVRREGVFRPLTFVAASRYGLRAFAIAAAFFFDKSIV